MPKRTFQPKKRKRRRTHGFRIRMSSSGGKRVLKARKAKGRQVLTPNKFGEGEWAKDHYVR